MTAATRARFTATRTARARHQLFKLIHAAPGFMLDLFAGLMLFAAVLLLLPVLL